jgi:hypothetical protein
MNGEKRSFMNHFTLSTSKFINSLLTASACGALFLFIGCADRTADRSFWSPYQDLNWSEIGHYDSEFHTHPNMGDYGGYDPHQTVDRYREEGYKILTLAEHSSHIPHDHMNTIYPWTELSQIYERIKDVTPRGKKEDRPTKKSTTSRGKIATPWNWVWYRWRETNFPVTTTRSVCLISGRDMSTMK